MQLNSSCHRDQEAEPVLRRPTASPSLPGFTPHTEDVSVWKQGYRHTFRCAFPVS